MSDGERPWWSSGSGPDAEVEPGPAAEERRERAARQTHERADRDGSSNDGERRDAGSREHVHPPLADGEVCQVCPICAALRMVGEVRPDLLVHLAEAARHLTLAAKTVVDAQASGFRERGLERIPLDDDPT